MNTIIDFRADKSKWDKTPTIMGWDQVLLLEDIPGRIVYIGRDHGPDDEFQPWINSSYVVHEAKEDIEQFYDELANGNYVCEGLWDDIEGETKK